MKLRQQIMTNFDAIYLCLVISTNLWSRGCAAVPSVKSEETDMNDTGIDKQLIKEFMEELDGNDPISLALGLSPKSINLPLLIDFKNENNLEKLNEKTNDDLLSNLFHYQPQNADLNIELENMKSTTVIDAFNRLKGEKSLFNELQKAFQKTVNDRSFKSPQEKENVKGKNETLGSIDVTERNDMFYSGFSETTMPIYDLATGMATRRLSSMMSSRSTDMQMLEKNFKLKQNNMLTKLHPKIHKEYSSFKSAVESTDLADTSVTKEDRFGFKKQHKSKLSENDVYQILNKIPNSYQKLLQLRKHEDNKLKSRGKIKNDVMIRSLLKNVENFVGHIILKDMFERYQQRLDETSDEKVLAKVAERDFGDDEDLAELFIELSNNDKNENKITLLKRILQYQ